MDRVVLHSDCNCFYASVEMLHHPEYGDRPLAVGGDPEKRHGIVLTANYPAKRRGVKTGMALWQARQACPEIIFVPPRMRLYLRFSDLVRSIYEEYTDRVESFGLDECWLDVTGSASVKGDGEKIAQEIRRRVREELGITVSVGVSWNKIYAKLGSDYKKPDAVTVFSRENAREKVYPLPVEDLFYVGRATRVKLYRRGIRTIGQLADADEEMLAAAMGKMGRVLRVFARGEDPTEVSLTGSSVPVKSVGNGTTTPRDLVNEEEVSAVLYLLSEAVAARLREIHFMGSVVEVAVRDTHLAWDMRQHRRSRPTCLSEEIHRDALSLFQSLYRWTDPVRSLTVRVSALVPDTEPQQTEIFVDELRREKLLRADRAVDEIRGRFGYGSICRGSVLAQPDFSALDAKDEIHMIRPHGYMERGNHVLD